MDASQLMRVCCMGVLDDEAASDAEKAPPNLPERKEPQEKHARDVQVKEKGQRKKAVSNAIGKGWDKKRFRHKSEEQAVDVNKIVHTKIPRQRSEEAQSPRTVSRLSSEESSSDSKSSPCNRLLRKISREKSDDSKPPEVRFCRKVSPSAIKLTEIQVCRKVSPSERKLLACRPRDWKHCRHISDTGDVRAYRSDFFEARYEAGQSAFFRSSSVKSGKTNLDSPRGTTLRCGCKVALHMEDNRDIELKRTMSSNLEVKRRGSVSPPKPSPRQRRASPSPHPRPPSRRW